MTDSFHNETAAVIPGTYDSRCFLIIVRKEVISCFSFLPLLDPDIPR